MSNTDFSLKSAIHGASSSSTLSCEAAMELSASLSVEPMTVGQGADDAGVKLTACQLGLFGHGQAQQRVRPADCVAPELRAAIEARLVEGKLPCADAWAIAASLGCRKLDVSSACEALNIRISACQLGAF